MTRRFEVLDAFRGLCALSVVLFHFRAVGSVTELPFFRGSELFVEFFFALSGFVLAHSYGFRDNLRFKSYIASRFFRLYPLYFCMLMVFIGLEVVKYIAYKAVGFSFNTLPFTGHGSLSEILPNLLMVQSWTSLTDPLSFNYPSWSISIEFYLYVLLFLTLYLFGRYKVWSWLTIAVMVLGLMGNNSTLFQPYVFNGLSCFFGGAFTYVVFTKIKHISIPFIIGSVIEVLLLSVVAYLVSNEIADRYIYATLLFYIVVLFFAFESGVVSKLLNRSVFQVLGKWSYSIYLTHAAILFMVTSIALVGQKVLGKEIAPMINDARFIDLGSAFYNNVLVVAILSIVIFVSMTTYKYIELKGQALGKRLVNHKIVIKD
ncbi:MULTISPECIES: acyltransferase [unclassified Photobacterium]|uniref:acyltransferase family protein n=1 Tax=unclassified Photobacterium TaxID=2628852 RepID=UPI001EDD3516|nr:MULTISPECIES: acyltransferase [unclassified Photobacterium]MCG3864985.1 acyltransferase [Photobacterium sp. Ph6]MCG3876393.1 acyltransferase [Photobacterium sp. Ph5]